MQEMNLNQGIAVAQANLPIVLLQLCLDCFADNVAAKLAVLRREYIKLKQETDERKKLMQKEIDKV